jgi:hypothetical protein
VSSTAKWNSSPPSTRSATVHALGRAKSSRRASPAVGWPRSTFVYTRSFRSRPPPKPHRIGGTESRSGICSLARPYSPSVATTWRRPLSPRSLLRTERAGGMSRAVLPRTQNNELSPVTLSANRICCANAPCQTGALAHRAVVKPHRSRDYPRFRTLPRASLASARSPVRYRYRNASARFRYDARFHRDKAPRCCPRTAGSP